MCSRPPVKKCDAGGGGRLALHFNAYSACTLLVGLLSSAYLAFLAGQRARIALLSRGVESELASIQQGNDRGQPGEAFGVGNRTEVSSTQSHEEDRGGKRARLPSAQHLSADVRNVEPNLLRSESALAKAMVSLINGDSRLEMLSYHCHALTPEVKSGRGTTDADGDRAAGGVTCAAILVDGHVVVHSRPEDGVLAMDLFTQDEKADLVSLPPVIERLFSVHDTTTIESESSNNVSSVTERSNPKMRWSHKLRGFRAGFKDGSNNTYRRDRNPFDQEFGEDILRRRDFDRKVPLVSTKTKFQHVDVYELSHMRGPAYAALGIPTTRADAVSEDGSEILYQKVRPDRALFIDGVLQSSLYGEAAYHEALVHPAMLAHPDPRRVAIIGGGEGATLREVLKHNTVEEAVMIEIDAELADVARTYLPEWSDCSDILDEGGADSCFDDPRATVHYEDAFGFFLDKFGEDDEDDLADSDAKNDGAVDEEEDEEERFDVIVMDALDPDDFGDFVDKLYNDTEFIRSLYNGLTESGVLVVQAGSIPHLSEPPDEMSVFYNRAHMITKLEEAGFESVHAYDESHCHFYTPWQFLVAFRDGGSRANWRRGPARVEIELHRRLHRTKSGRRALRYLDGDTVRSYQTPPKVVQSNLCRKEPAPFECEHRSGLHPRQKGAADQQLVGEIVGRRLPDASKVHDTKSTFPLMMARIGCNGNFSSHDYLSYPVYSPAVDRRGRGKSSCCW